MNNLLKDNNYKSDKFRLWEKFTCIYGTDCYEKTFTSFKRAGFTEEEINQLFHDLFKLTLNRMEGTYE